MRSFAKDSLSGFSKRRIWLFLHLLHVLMLSQTSSMPTSNPTDPSVLQFEQPPQPDLHIINPIPISDPTPTPVLVSDVLMDTIFDGGPDQPCTGAECAGGAGGAQRKPHQQKGGSQTSQRAGSAHTSATGSSAGSPISKPSSSAIPVDVNDAVKKYVAGKSLSLPDVHHVIVDQTSLPADVAGSPPVAVSSPVPPAPPSNSDAKSPAVPHPPSPGQQGPAGPRHPQHKPPQPTPAPDAHLFAQPIAAVVDVAQQPARPIGVKQPRGNLALVPVPSPHHPMPRLPGHQQHVLTQQQPILPGIAQSVPVNNILHQPTLPRLPVQDAEAGEQAEAPDPGELMCGAVEYEVGEELCCNGTVRQVQEGAAHLARCCGRAAYDTRTQTCCEYPVSSTSPQRRVLTKVITTAMETCCSSTPAQVQQQVLLCCGHLSYDPRSSMCCNGHVVQGSPQNGHRCCGAEKYIQGVEACCGNAVVYDPRVGTCCGSKITSTRSNSQLSCCGNQPFQPRSGSLCCSGILYHNTGQNPSRVACCGRAKYNRFSQRCCPGGRVVQGTNQQQCSTVAPTLNGVGQHLQQHLQPAHPALPRPQYPYPTGALPGGQYRSRTLPASPYHYAGNQMGRGNLPLANTMADPSRADYGPDAGYVPSSVSMIGNHPGSYNQYITNQVRNHHAPATGTGYAQGHHRSVNSPPGDNTGQQSRKTAATGGKPGQWQDQADIFLNSMSGGATHTSNGTASP